MRKHETCCGDRTEKATFGNPKPRKGEVRKGPDGRHTPTTESATVGRLGLHCLVIFFYDPGERRGGTSGCRKGEG